MATLELNLQKGKPPVICEVSDDNLDCMLAFIRQFDELKTDVRMLKQERQFNPSVFGYVSEEEYTNAIIKLLELENMNCGGSEVAAQVLLGLYNGYRFHTNLVDIACRLDSDFKLAAITAIIGRGQLMREPHQVIDDGDKRFKQMWRDWSHFEVSERYTSYCKQCNG